MRAVFSIDSSWRIYKNCDTGGRGQHEFHPSVVFCAAGRTASGVKEGVLKCVHISVDWAYGNPCFCTGRRTGVSAPSHLRLFTGVCAGSLCHGQNL